MERSHATFHQSMNPIIKLITGLTVNYNKKKYNRVSKNIQVTGYKVQFTADLSIPNGNFKENIMTQRLRSIALNAVAKKISKKNRIHDLKKKKKCRLF